MEPYSPYSWGDKPYHSLNYYLKQTFGEKIYKLALDGAMTCPNRDGTLGTGGCIFAAEAVPVILPSRSMPVSRNRLRRPRPASQLK